MDPIWLNSELDLMRERQRRIRAEQWRQAAALWGIEAEIATLRDCLPTGKPQAGSTPASSWRAILRKSGAQIAVKVATSLATPIILAGLGFAWRYLWPWLQRLTPVW